MDLFSRRIIGWSMSYLITEDLTLAAITMAYSRRKPKNTVNLHSDQGSQYTSRNSQKLLETLNIEASMSRRGNCWDNAVAESFFSNLKKEKIQRRVFKSLDEAKQEVFHYIEMFYNPKRRHTYHDRISPVEFEKQYFENQKNG
jgi:putative transposase